MTREQDKTTTTTTMTTPTTDTMAEEECKECIKVKDDSTKQIVVVSRDELTELVRAIKFAKPDASQRDVFKEITEVIACSSSFNSSSTDKSSSSSENVNSRVGEYLFLKDAVQLNDVKKVWKKATTPATTSSALSASSKNINGTTAGKNLDSDLAEKLKLNSSGGVPELFTVGMNTNANANANANELSAVQILANDYVSSFLEEQAVKSAKEASMIANDYVHVFLDVPADRSGTRPHQALINFQNSSKNKKAAGAAAGGKGKGKRKKGGSKKNSSAKSSSDHVNAAGAAAEAGGSDGDNSDLPFDDAIIVKIQKAAPMHPNDTTKYPMLVYDQTKTYKTFIHPDPDPDPVAAASDPDRNAGDDDDDGATTLSSTKEKEKPPPGDSAGGGYDKISSLIQASGVGGAVGAFGGTKCYFFGRISSSSSSSDTPPNSGRNKQKGPDILSIYIKSLAPYQEEW